MKTIHRVFQLSAIGIFLLCTVFSMHVYATEYVTITSEMQVVDTFNGVDAVYHPNAADGSDTTYSCAAYVKRYYNSVYGVGV